MMDAELQSRAARIKLFLMDCDGVLTDGRIWVLENHEDQKAFHTRDGLGLEWLHRAGLKSGVISGRVSSALTRRAECAADKADRDVDPGICVRVVSDRGAPGSQIPGSARCASGNQLRVRAPNVHLAAVRGAQPESHERGE